MNGGSPRAENPAEGAGNRVCSWSLYFGFLKNWQLPVVCGAEGAAGRVVAEPDVWTDGSLVQDMVSGDSSSGSVFFTGRTGHLWADRRWGHLHDDVGRDMATRSCRGYCSVPGPLQTVQRAETALYLVEVALGRYSFFFRMVLMQMRLLLGCLMPLRFGMMVVWSWIRSLVSVLLTLSCLLDHRWSDRRWGHVDRVLLDRVPHSSRGIFSVPGPLQTVQRAEQWRVNFGLIGGGAILMMVLVVTGFCSWSFTDCSEGRVLERHSCFSDC